MSATVSTSEMNNTTTEKNMVIAGMHKNVYFNKAFKRYYHQNGGSVKRKIAYFKKRYGAELDSEIFELDISNEQKVIIIKEAVSELKQKKYLEKYN